VGRTSGEWLWVVDDLVNGPDVVHAAADGHRVAASMETYLAQQVETTQ
jgi:glutamate synthase (NADPH/NADH) small chain